MDYLKNNSSLLILVVSVLSISLYITDFILTLIHTQGYAAEDFWYDINAVLYQLPLLLPALIGTFTYRKLHKKAGLAIGFLLYALPILYIYTAPVWATDPLQAGLMAILIGFPAAIILTGFLLNNLRIQGKMKK